jgi:hypothetical protein
MNFAIRRFLRRNLQARMEICRLVAKALEKELESDTITESERLDLGTRRNELAKEGHELRQELAQLEREDKRERAMLN